jgi:SulP family sulfate permease
LADFPIATAIRRTFQQGYSLSRFRQDLLAGLVVGIVALPLSMALAIAVGVPPQHGLYTAIIAGVAVALTGGSKHNVTGPTAAFVVILAPIVTKYGLSGLLTAGLMAGVLLVAMGAMRLGRLIQFIPHPVTTGFTAGIAVVIATLQIKDALGLTIAKMPESYTEKVEALWHARDGASIAELSVTIVMLALLVGIPRITKVVPAPLVALVVVTLLVLGVSKLAPSFHVATIGSRFQTTVGDHVVAGIPPLPPTPMVPWGHGHLTFAQLRDLFPAALAIAMLGAIESLLCAVIADGMTGKVHDPNAELVGLGIGNILAPFFGGIAATGALARTATSIRAGATSPIAPIIHSLLVLLAVVLLAPLVAYVPMAALAALLFVVAYNMSDIRHAFHILKVAPRSDIAVMVTCFLLTVIFDMVVAIGVGVVLAALLFMRRMSEMTRTRALSLPEMERNRGTVPKGVQVYEIAGPLFFGAAARAMSTLAASHDGARAIVLALGNVPSIDATGLVALESMIDRLHRERKIIIIAGPLPEPRSIFQKAKLEDEKENTFVVDSLDEGIQLASDLILLTPESIHPPAPKPA